jgi:hypothetical protein
MRSQEAVTGWSLPWPLYKCFAVPMIMEATEWNTEGEREVKHNFIGTSAFVQDASDYSATLYVRDDFGCVMWRDGR